MTGAGRAPLRIVVLALAAVAALVSGCSLFEARGGTYPEACEPLGYSEVRCKAIVDRAAEIAGIDKAEIVGARFVPPDHVDGDAVSLGGRRLAIVALRLANGDERIQDVWCVGVGREDDRACSNDPMITVSGAGVDHDVPCTGEAPEGCATEPPPPRPASVAAARPLEIAARDIPLDHVGSYEVRLGEAGLPDGYLTDRSLTLADRRPTMFWIDGGVQLVVRPTEPGRPDVGSRYREPYDGVEPVDVFLVFNVVETSPGAVLRVRDLVVR